MRNGWMKVMSVVAAVMLCVVLVAQADKASLSYSQTAAVYAPSGLAMFGQWRFDSLEWLSATGGGYGTFGAPYQLYYGASYGWHGLILFDYVTGNYTEILYFWDAAL